MRTDLSAAQWENVAAGSLDGPDGVRYSRRSTRANRRDCDGLVATGVPLVAHHWAGGLLDWFDGPDALNAWREMRPALVVQAVPSGKVTWTAGRWEALDGRVVVFLTGHC